MVHPRARWSRFYRQFDPTAPLRLAQPAELPATNLATAFPPSLAAQLRLGAPSAKPGTSTPTRLGLYGTPATCCHPHPTLAGILSSDLCAGDENMLFVPSNPYAGTQAVIAVTPARRSDARYVRLTGPVQVGTVSEGQGLKGWVYEWTFYTDGARPCVRAEFVASPRFDATATPRPGALPTPPKRAPIA